VFLGGLCLGTTRTRRAAYWMAAYCTVCTKCVVSVHGGRHGWQNRFIFACFPPPHVASLGCAPSAIRDGCSSDDLTPKIFVDRDGAGGALVHPLPFLCIVRIVQVALARRVVGEVYGASPRGRLVARRAVGQVRVEENHVSRRDEYGFEPHCPLDIGVDHAIGVRQDALRVAARAHLERPVALRRGVDRDGDGDVTTGKFVRRVCGRVLMRQEAASPWALEIELSCATRRIEPNWNERQQEGARRAEEEREGEEWGRRGRGRSEARSTRGDVEQRDSVGQGEGPTLGQGQGRGRGQDSARVRRGVRRGRAGAEAAMAR